MPKNFTPKSYAKMGMIAFGVVAIATAGFFAVRGFSGGTSVERAVADISANAVSASEIKIAVLRMDAIQEKANVLSGLRKQRSTYENNLKSGLEKKQKELEKEKSEIEKSQDMLSRDALQRRVADYQKKVAAFQREISEKAQEIDAAFQKSLVTIQEKHLDGIINAIIAKKKLTMVLDGRFARISETAAPALDITDDVISALNKKISKFTMEKPKGF